MSRVGTSTRYEGAPRGAAIVIGASLGGLLVALTVARSGYQVTVMERLGPDLRTGGALMVSDGLIERVTGWDRRNGARRIPTSLPGGGHAWETIHASLYDTAGQDDRITLLHHTRVVAAGQDLHQAWVTTDDGRTVTAELVVGADGHRSVVRGAVAPDQPDAAFAGYLIWLGVIDELSLPAKLRGDYRFDGGAFLDDGYDVMFGYAMPGRDGDYNTGHRQIGWAWYDGAHNDFLRSNGNVRGNVVHHSVTASEIPERIYDELADIVRDRWPTPWADVMLLSIARRSVTGTPIAEYVPTTLTKGRLAIVGDAAHVQTPMTGQGFGSALADAEALAEALDKQPVPEALRAYERNRLQSARTLVLSGHRFSRSFTARATRLDSLSQLRPRRPDFK